MELKALELRIVDLPPAASRRWRLGEGLPDPAAILAVVNARHLAAIAAIVFLIALLATEPPF